MNDNFSQRVKDVIAYSKEEALRLGHDNIGTEHLVLGILRDGEGKAVKLLESLNVDLQQVRQRIEIMSPPNDRIDTTQRNLQLTKQAERALKTTFLEAKLFHSQSVNTVHLLLCILRNEGDPITKLMQKFDVDYNTLKEEFKFHYQEDTTPQTPSMDASFSDEDDQSRRSGNTGKPGSTTNAPKSKTPVLDNFGRDLSSLADDGKLDPVVGREKEIERVSQILSRRKKNNPLLIGEPGLGKSAIA